MELFVKISTGKLTEIQEIIEYFHNY